MATLSIDGARPLPPRSEPSSGPAASRTSLGELSLLFLRLGATAFGGPAAHIALMNDEVVRRRRWLSEERFLDLLGAVNLIPGPNSTELAIHIGWERRRFAGLLVAGVSFIVPAMLISGVFGWAYLRFHALPALGFVLYGVKPVILAVVAQAIWGLLPKAAHSAWLRVLALGCVALAASNMNELGLLFGAGALCVARAFARGNTRGTLLVSPWLPLALGSGAASGVPLSSLFWVFAKIGSVLFGSGYVLLAFLRADLVLRLGWLTEAQLIDAIAVGQLTPGPVFTSATFIGYLLAGPGGALVATAGIFLPAFVFVALSGPLLPKLRSAPAAAAFLDGVNVASLALMIVVTSKLARATLVDLPSVVLALLALLALIRFKLNATWLVVGGAASGWALHALGVGAG
jgi:chromate transporter